MKMGSNTFQVSDIGSHDMLRHYENGGPECIAYCGSDIHDFVRYLLSAVSFRILYILRG